MGECLAAAVPLLRDESEPVRSATVSIVLGIVVALEQPVWSANPPYEGDLASIRAMLVRPLEHAMTLGLDDNAATNVREFLSRGPM